MLLISDWPFKRCTHLISMCNFIADGVTVLLTLNLFHEVTDVPRIVSDHITWREETFPGCYVVQGKIFCTAYRNNFGSTVRTLLHVTLLLTRILWCEPRTTPSRIRIFSLFIPCIMMVCTVCCTVGDSCIQPAIRIMRGQHLMWIKEEWMIVDKKLITT